MSQTPQQPPRAHARQGETLDALIHRLLGRTQGHTEATLAANPGLADLGAVLPEGQSVTLAQAPAPVREMVNLWD